MMKQDTFTLKEDYIRLDDLLKVTGNAMTGGQAKVMIQSGQVTLDGEVCLMRGKKLRGGEVIAIPTENTQIAVERGTP